jgi:HK97 family phage portal protein
VEQLGVIPPDRVQVQLVGGKPLYVLSHLDGRQTTHDENDVVHIRTALTSSDGVTGLSPVAQCREALGLARALGEQASALVANDATPLGVLTVPAGPGDEDLLENLRGAMEKRHGGPRNRGRVAVLSGDVAFSAISLSPVDAEFIAQRRLSTAEIARLFNVPPWLINAESASSLTYSNSESQLMAFQKVALAPLLCAVEQAITNSRLCVGPDKYVEFLADGFLRADSVARAQVYTAALDPVTGWMTRPEARARENLPAEAA